MIYFFLNFTSMIQLYIAMSLDGYIAREDDSLDWLTDFPNPDKLDYGYPAFYEGIDIVVMGRKTYDEIISFGVDWPYADCTSYVISSKLGLEVKSPDTFIVNDVSKGFIQKLRNESKKNIWLVGGGGLNSHFLGLNEIDEMIITIIPVVLGKGKPLFPNAPVESNFKLKNTEALSTGAVILTYERK